MILGKYPKHKISCIVAFILIVLVLCSVVVFPHYIKGGVTAQNIDAGASKESYSPVQSRYSFAVLPESITTSRSNRIIEQEGRRALCLNKVMLYGEVKPPYFLFTAMILYSYLIIVQRTKKHTSKIALRIGGHSPPVHYI